MTGPKVKDPINRNWSEDVKRPKNTSSEVYWLNGRYNRFNRRAKFQHNRGAHAPYETLEHFLQVNRACLDDQPRAANMRLHREIRHNFRNGILTQREDWAEVRDLLMWEALCHRYSLQSQYPDLRVDLMDTSPKVTLFCDSNVGCENHWGVCWCPTCKGKLGENMYGHFLMEIRKALLSGTLK